MHCIPSGTSGMTSIDARTRQTLTPFSRILRLLQACLEEMGPEYSLRIFFLGLISRGWVRMVPWFADRCDGWIGLGLVGFSLLLVTESANDWKSVSFLHWSVGLSYRISVLSPDKKLPVNSPGWSLQLQEFQVTWLHKNMHHALKAFGKLRIYQGGGGSSRVHDY